MYFRNVHSIHVRIIFHSHDCITSDYHPAKPPPLSSAYPPAPSLQPAVNSAVSPGKSPQAVSAPQHNPASAENHRGFR